jgi:hypothetical protein
MFDWTHLVFRNLIWPGNAPPAPDWSAGTAEQLQQHQQQLPSWHIPQDQPQHHFSPYPSRELWNTLQNSPGFNQLGVYPGKSKDRDWKRVPLIYLLCEQDIVCSLGNPVELSGTLNQNSAGYLVRLADIVGSVSSGTLPVPVGYE